MPRDLDLDFEMQDDELRDRPVRRAPRREPAGRGAAPRGGRGASASRRKKTDTTSIIILIVEIVVFIALIALFFVLKSKIVDSGSSSSEEAAAESTTNNGVNVESADFSLTCTKVQLVMDADNNTAALVYFTFVNKTDNPLAMSGVFPPKVTQNGADWPEDTNLAETPAEIANKDMQVSGGQSVECCYAFKLSDQTSPLTLTIHDNYSTFTDIGSTEIPIS